MKSPFKNVLGADIPTSLRWDRMTFEGFVKKSLRILSMP
jgi:hypothetical protein